MRRRDEGNVVTAFRLQFEHHLGETLTGDLVLLLRFQGLRDLVILAINTPEIAVAEKDIARSVRTRKARLLAKVRGVGRNDRQLAGVAGGDLIVQTVVTAIFWTDGA